MRFLNKGKWQSREKTAITSGNRGLSLRSIGLLASRARLLFSLAPSRGVSNLPLGQTRRRVEVKLAPALPERTKQETKTSRDAGSNSRIPFERMAFQNAARVTGSGRIMFSGSLTRGMPDGCSEDPDFFSLTT